MPVPPSILAQCTGQELADALAARMAADVTRLVENARAIEAECLRGDGLRKELAPLPAQFSQLVAEAAAYNLELRGMMEHGTAFLAEIRSTTLRGATLKAGLTKFNAEVGTILKTLGESPRG